VTLDWKRPSIIVTPPGPKAQEIIQLDKSFTSPSYGRPYGLVVDRGRGAYLSDVDGNVYLDFNAGIAVCTTGHCHPEVVAAIKNQSERFIHYASNDFYNTVQANLAEKLGKLVDSREPWRVFFSNSGTESVEAAIKLARYRTRRQKFIGFYGGFHGRTMGSLAFTASKSVQRSFFAPLMPGVTHVPYAYCYRCPYNLKPDSCDMACVKFIEDVLFQQVMDPEEVAAIVVEPIQGEGGYIVPPAGFHRELRSLCDRYGILLVDDEVQAGMGRTGKMFAMENFGVKPDIIALAKGLASGMVMGAMLAKPEVMTWGPGAHGNTFGGNPLSGAAALVTIKLLQESLIDNAARVGGYLKGRLAEMQERHRLIGDVRGIGLMVGVELVKDRETKEAAVEEADSVVRRCFENGLLLLGCGRSTIRFSPPLIVTEAQVDQAMDVFESALEAEEGKS